MKSACSLVILDREIQLQDTAGQVLQRRSMSMRTSDASSHELANGLTPLFAAEPKWRAVTLVIPASWCYLQDVQAPQRRPSRTALRYSLEEYIPDNIDELACDFQCMAPGRWLAAGLPRTVLDRWVALARGLGLEIERIELRVPILTASNPSKTLVHCDADHWIVGTRSESDSAFIRVLRFADDTPLAERCSALRDAVGELDGGLALTGPLDEPQISEIRREIGIAAAEPSVAGRTPAAVLTFDLGQERSELHGGDAPRRRAPQRLLVTSLAALMFLAASLGIRGWQRGQQFQQIARWEASLYGQLFPGEPLPSAVGLRIQAARKSLELQAKAATPESAGSVDPLQTLTAVLTAIPSDIRLQIEELRIDGRALSLRGNTREHADAERLAQALDRQPTIVCPPPRTDRRREGGVRLSLVAQVAAEGTNK